MALDSSSSEQYATPPSWPHLDRILRDRLGWLHHSLSCDSLSAVEAAVQFSSIVGDLLMEFGLIKSSNCSGHHHPRRIETSVKNLSIMKNASRKYMQSDNGNFITLVRAHNKVLNCFHRQVNSRETCRQEREFRDNPWKYVNKRLKPSDNTDPSFDCCTATSYFSEQLILTVQ